jgi:hypothetical protein
VLRYAPFLQSGCLLEVLDKSKARTAGHLLCLLLGPKHSEQRRHPMDQQFLATVSENSKGGGPFPFCHFLRAGRRTYARRTRRLLACSNRFRDCCLTGCKMERIGPTTQFRRGRSQPSTGGACVRLLPTVRKRTTSVGAAINKRFRAKSAGVRSNSTAATCPSAIIMRSRWPVSDFAWSGSGRSSSGPNRGFGSERSDCRSGRNLSAPQPGKG